ncbi:ribonuclease e inhibitor rraa dimethylmenaquinone methyltransferase [Penicillium angulare]|uniref:Ribonuclease e inhibitor rraa dimethylmenaquinone methyltransferase n=1 Tax=Penicillium angulare TaxID=116970 RepID=A0A9W9FC71_9EURO|nr:ribonuclease e inhibitor rraa dimethylmenaquinone methyltransferase [Penicillium angulare]
MATRQRIETLSRFTSCDIGDALVKLKYPYGGFLDGIKMYSPGSKGPVVGPAITVRMVETSDISAPKLDQHFVDYNQSGHIMYIHQPPGLSAACWGGLMSTRAQHLGAAGAVVNGRIRDQREHKELKFPVFGRDSSILGSNTFTKASQVDVPLQFKGELWIHPGDIILGDEEGVVVTPVSLIDQVIAFCEERAEIDKLTVECLMKGEAMGPVLRKLRK